MLRKVRQMENEKNPVTSPGVGHRPDSNKQAKVSEAQRAVRRLPEREGEVEEGRGVEYMATGGLTPSGEHVMQHKDDVFC